MRAFTSTADVVVIGGGVVGASTAYHLAAAGVEHVVLLERADAVATGSTGACAGGFRHQFSSRINIELSLASVPMILGFSREHGLPLDVVQDGYLFLVRDERDWDEFRAGAAFQRSLGVDTQLLTPEEAEAIAPGIAIGDVVGATFCSDDGIADPAGLTQGYATLARRAGADLRLGTEAIVIEEDDGVVTAVRTADDVISAPVVVDAAGPWAGVLAATAGVRLPLEPIPRMVVTTGPFPGAPARRTLVIDAATSYYFHKEGAGVLTGMGGRDEHPSFSTDVDIRFIEEELLPTAVRVFPPIEQAGVASMWAGLYEMTPDRHPIIGESPVTGLFLANGFSGHGFQHAPVVGKLMAELIVEGRARTVDISSLGLDRFERGDLVVEGRVV
ncbi:MAG: NAD(P)/FAD-dependent oxidoreductase [Actinomycetota bacterium]